MFFGSSFSSWDRDCALAPPESVIVAIATTQRSLPVMRTLINSQRPTSNSQDALRVDAPWELGVGNWELGVGRGRDAHHPASWRSSRAARWPVSTAPFM